MRAIPYHEFINKELIMFSNYDNHRSIPNLVDGLKPGQRKIIFCCFKRKLTTEIKVAQLGPYVAEHSCYHHGEISLASTIVGLAQSFVGSNNLSLLVPKGQFGTRAMGGKDMASARYIFTSLSGLTRKLFNPEDDYLLNYQTDEGMKIEPHYYVPVIPLVLVNGAEGIGTGWSTMIPPFNPLDLIAAYRSRITGGSFGEAMLMPWFKGYTGTLSATDKGYSVQGVFERIGLESLKISELPIRKWTQDYKKFLEELCQADPPFITEMREYHTENRVHFEVKIPQLREMTDEEVLKKLKLQGTLSMTNLVLFDSNRKIKKYQNIREIMDEHYGVRLEFYHKRKEFLVKKLKRQVELISNKVRFILEVIKGTLIISNKKSPVLLAELKERGYFTLTQLNKIYNEISIYVDPEYNEKEEEAVEGPISKSEYDYLLNMPLWSLTYEKVQKLMKEQDEKSQELEILKKITVEQMWITDLDELHEIINKVWGIEEAERLKRPKPRGNTRKVPAKRKGKENNKLVKVPPPKPNTPSVAEIFKAHNLDVGEQGNKKRPRTKGNGPKVKIPTKREKLGKVDETSDSEYEFK